MSDCISKEFQVGIGVFIAIPRKEGYIYSRLVKSWDARVRTRVFLLAPLLIGDFGQIP